MKQDCIGFYLSGASGVGVAGRDCPTAICFLSHVTARF